MDCQQYRELISAAVDSQLTEAESSAFREHTVRCPSCRSEYEAEAATKAFVRSHAHRVRTPSHIMQRIGECLEAEGRAGWRSPLAGVLARPLVRSGIAFALGIAAVLLLLNVPSPDASLTHSSLFPRDIVRQSLVNHSAIISGDITPQFASSEPEEMREFFSGITEYAVHVPRLKDCVLLGGVRSEYDGVPLAHVVYRHGNEFVYLYQTCLETVMKGEKLSLPGDAKSDLMHTGLFTMSEPDGRSIVVWMKGRTLCAAVAHMSRSELLQALAAVDPGH